MTRRREMRYAWNGDVAFAYEVFGAGTMGPVCFQGHRGRRDAGP